MLKCIADNGMLYGNLRTENILIKMNKCMHRIDTIKYLSFGTLSSIEDSEKMHIPDQIEHLPPDLLKHLIESMRFAKDNAACPVTMQRVRENV